MANYNKKLANMTLTNFKKYIAKHHKEDVDNAEKIYKSLGGKIVEKK